MQRERGLFSAGSRLVNAPDPRAVQGGAPRYGNPLFLRNKRNHPWRDAGPVAAQHRSYGIP
jgi:hypothetical protein